MKKVLALFLAVLMVVPMMVFSTSAAEATAFPTTEFVPIVTENSMPAADCDYETLDSENIGGIDWSAVGTTSRISYESASKAVCLTFPEGATDRSGFRFMCNPWQSYKGMTTLGFDLYISDVAAANVNDAWKMHLVTTGGEAILAASLSKLAEWSNITLEDGWNRFEIPLGCFNKVSTTMSLVEFKFYKNNDNAIGSVTFKLKNVYFADTIVPTVMASSFGHLANNDAINSAAFSSAKPYMSKVGSVTLQYNSGQDYTSAQFKHTGLVPNGSGFRIDTSWGEMDITKMTKFCFDLYINNISYVDTSVAWRVQLSFTDKDDKNGTAEYNSNTNTSLANYAAMSGITLKSGWNHFELPMVPNQGDSAKGLIWLGDKLVDSRGLKYIRIYTNDSSKQIGADGKQIIVGLKNVYFANDDIEWATTPTRSLIKDADMAGMTPDEQADATKWHASAKPQWRQTNVGTVFYDTVNKGVGYTEKTLAANTYRVQLNVSDTLTSGWEKLCFDLYISNAANLANDAKWNIILMNGSTACPIKGSSTTLAAYTENGALVTGWNHIEIPLTTTDFNSVPEKITAIRFDKRNNDAFKGETTVLFNNVYLKGADPKSVTAKVASAQPSLTDSFNLTYQVSADGELAYRPMVELTYGDKTTRQPLNADGTFDFNDIFAHRLSDSITTTVFSMDKKGDIHTTKHTYSVKDYCEMMLNVESIEGYSAEQLAALKRLLSDILYYGAAAQTYADYNTEMLATNVSGIVANPNVGEKFQGPEKVLTGRPSGDYSGTGPKWRGVTLVLDSAMSIRYSFTADSLEGLTLNCSNGKSYTSFASASDANGTYYYIDVPVFAYEFDTAFTVSFEGVENYDLTYSVNHYVATKHDPSMIKTSALIEAIYNYGVSAKDYLSKTSAE